MPSDYYLLIAGINGETQAQGMTNNIELESWSWGASNPASLGGKGLAAGKPSLSDFTVSFALEAASFQIVKNLVNGTHVATRDVYRPQDGRRRVPLIITWSSH